MTIASEITRINNNIASAYTECNSKGATMPATQNSANLATCISSITAGGGLGAVEGITREIVNGVYQMPSSSFTFSLPSTATDLGSYALYYAFYHCTGLTSVDLSSLTTISGSHAMDTTFISCTGLTSVDLSSLTSIQGTYVMSNAFSECTGLTSVDLSNLTSIQGNNAMSYAFESCTNLTTVKFDNLETIGSSTTADYGQLRGCFYDPDISSMTFPKLKEIYCTISNANYGTFSDNCSIEKFYFPKLDTISYAGGGSDVASKNIFSGCDSLAELHFAAANQAAIEASPGYSTAWGRGAGNVTIYFDL